MQRGSRTEQALYDETPEDILTLLPARAPVDLHAAFVRACGALIQRFGHLAKRKKIRLEKSRED